jgi:predicted O-linked N-acetylglucosamine transferase (SPINDLY family)
VLRIKPDYPQALNALGLVRQKQHQPQQALDLFRQALQRQRDYAPAMLNLGNALSDLGRPDEVERWIRAALRARPNYAEAWHDLGAFYEHHRRSGDALAAYQKAWQLKPNSAHYLAALENAKRHACDWSGRPESLNRLLEIVRDHVHPARRVSHVRRGSPDPAETDTSSARVSDPDETPDRRSPEHDCPLWPAASIRFPTTNEDRLAIARHYAGRISARVGGPVGEVDPAKWRSAAGERIRLGFLSHEFGDHIVSYLMQGVYPRLDRSMFQVFAFAYSPDDGSVLRRQIAADCDHFRDITSLPVEQAARRIAEQRIQILVDMNAYMPGGRPEIAAFRPAPVQVSYRYPATMGAGWIDYLLADRTVIPPEHERFYSERPVWLPNTYLCAYNEQPPPPPAGHRRQYGLPEEAFVYCSFNQSHKLDPEIFDVWMRIMRHVPGSVLWQIESQPLIQDNLRREAQTRGVSSDRLVFADKVPLRQHLARYPHADLFLDTLVHGAIVTAVDALRTGVPLLTCLCDTFTTRAAASLVTAAGLPEMVARDLRQYEERAVELAQHPERLQALRKRMADDRDSCPLFDTPRFVRNLEQAFLQMWQTFASGDSPRSIEVGG